MIGSLMSRMGMAEKLSVAQLQKAVQDGTLPAYVGVPLIQDKLQQEQAAKAAAAGMQQPQGQPPIAQQVMQAAQAQEAAQGIEAVPSNLPEQGFAGGGIVAFAAGGDTEDDDEEDGTLEERRQAAETQAMFDMASRRLAQGAKGSEGAGIENAGVGIKPESTSGIGINPESKGGIGIKPPEGVAGLQAYILQKESRGQRYDKNGNLITSSKGAQGEMQVMPGTARDPGFGIKPARDNSPEELRRVGDEYVAALYNKYRDPKLAAMAYNWGPGNVDKWLAGGMKGPVPKETQMYVAQLAKGGSVDDVPRYNGFFDSLVQTPIAHLQSAGDTYSKNPEQALLGINTPAEAYVWNSALGTNYQPTVNMLGGPSEAAYAQGAKEGYNMSAGRVADSVAPAVIGAFTMGAGGAGASAANSMGQGYELNQMRSQYLQNPTTFQQQYGMVKGVNYADGGIVALAGGGTTPSVYTDPMGGAVPGEEPDYTQSGPGLFNDIKNWWKEHSYGTPERFKKEEEDKKKADDAKKAEEAKKNPTVQDVPPLITPEKPGIDTIKEAAPEDDIQSKYLKMLTRREADSANQRSIDNYMALLQAGLGMMGSKSLTGLGGIGEGASSGIAAKLAADKTRAAEDAATLKGYGTLHSIQQNAALRRELAAQSGDERKTRTLGVLQQNELKNVLNQNKLSMDSLTDPDLNKKIQQQVQKNLYNNPGYRKMYQDVYGAEFVPEPVTGGQPNYGKYGLAPKPQQ